MKVVKTNSSTEDAKIENIFWEPYEVTFTPSPSTVTVEEEISTLQDAVLWLAEDIIDHDDALHMLWEKLQVLEDNQLSTIRSLSDTIDVVDCMQKTNKMMLDIIVTQSESIKDLKSKFDFHDVTMLILFIVFLVWNLILSYNVFF